MNNKKIIILLPDGVGLRNFAYSNFIDIGKKRGYKIIFWNQTPFPLWEELGFEEIKLPQIQLHPLSDVFKRARKIIEVNQFYKKTANKVYFSYLFSSSIKGWKDIFKNALVSIFTLIFNSEKGLKRVRYFIKRLERKTVSYKKSKEQLIEQQPDFIFCTNQRASQAIAPLLAAQDLNIPTASFIFSWDNLPKATMVVETDYYLVWSDYMMKELVFYYPYIKSTQIRITGTPQFEKHTNPLLVASKEVFFEQHDLDLTKKYVCFSGDDITTSPYDQCYLEDVAKAVRALNLKGLNLGIIFRRCPVDFSDRFDEVLKEYQQEIVAINPKWEAFGKDWNQKMPLKEDLGLLINTIQHTELVINVGSSMIFDYVLQDKSCIFINYNPDGVNLTTWNIKNIYNYIHFRSMPSKAAVLWCHTKTTLTEIIKNVLAGKVSNVEDGKIWFETVAGIEPTKASERIWEAINNITS
jgi:hypothetical protein